jgi:hypothetical protein
MVFVVTRPQLIRTVRNAMGESGNSSNTWSLPRKISTVVAVLGFKDTKDSTG